MNTEQLHQEASLMTQRAFVARGYDEEETAHKLFEKAFELEKQAALSLRMDFDNEPTRSTLFRSAGSLAMNCKKYREAEKLFAHGLAGEPPEKIMHQLRKFFYQITKHLYEEAEAEVA